MTRKPKPNPRATILKRFLSTAIRVEYFGDEYRNSDVMRSMIAVIASHRLMSDNDRGKFINLTLHDAVQHLYRRTIQRHIYLLNRDWFA